MKKKSSIFYWSLALVLTLLSAVYQRLTGPTNPYRKHIEIFKSPISLKLPRSAETGKPLIIRIKVLQNEVLGKVFYRKHMSTDTWTETIMQRKDGYLTMSLPSLPPAGKVEYFVNLVSPGSMVQIPENGIVVARFRGQVPLVFLIPHIIFMFLAMLLSSKMGLGALLSHSFSSKELVFTLIVFIIGGFVLGPVVQKYAFGKYWTGFPFGYDLTDNKTLIAILVWGIAFLKRKKSFWWVAIAAFVTLAVFLIPHSIFGSTLDFSTGKLIQR